MPYTINLTDGSLLTTIADATIDTSTSLQLLGRNFAGYGGILATDFVHLLENFSNTSAPPSPLVGQLWYNTSSATVEVWNGTAWTSVGGASSGSIQITDTTADGFGLLFYDPIAPVNSKHYRIRVRDDSPYAGHLVVESLNDDLTINTLVLDTDNVGNFRITGRTSLLQGATAYGPGGWSSANVGKQMLLTSTASSNPGLGITDITGSNLWGIYNTSGTLSFAAMPAYTDGATNPTPVLTLTSSGARGITQATSDNSTYLATTAYVQAHVLGGGGGGGGGIGGTYYASDSGTANALVATLSPVPTSLASLQGFPINIKVANANTGATTFNPNALGATAVVDFAGRPLGAGVLNSGGIFTFIYNGTAFQLLSDTDTFVDSALGGIVLDGSGNTNGGNLLIKGNGATTPNKYINVLNGVLRVVNSAYTAAILQLSDAGDLSLIRNFNATGISSFGTSGQFYINPSNAGNQLLNFAASQYLQFQPGFGFALATTGAIELAAPGGVDVSAGLAVAGSQTVAGNLQTTGVTFFGSSGQFYMQPAGGNPFLAFASSQYLQFNPSFGFILNTTGGFQITAPGGVDISNGLTALGTITGGGKIRATTGAFGSGDLNCCTLLNDFVNGSVGGNGQYFYHREPNGVIIQAYVGASTTGADFINFPNAFPNACSEIIASEGNPEGWSGSQPTIFGCQQLSTTNFALYVMRWNGSGFFLAPGISYRYIAVGY